MENPPFTVIAGGAAKPAALPADKQVGVQSPKPPPGADLSPRERKVWDYICQQLTAAGLEHLTCGLTISIVVRTYIRWIDAERTLANVEAANNGTYFITTPNGHAQPHQAFYVVKGLKQDLLKWLPEACLTLPSVATAKSKLGNGAPQDDLFDNLVGHGRGHPSAASA